MKHTLVSPWPNRQCSYLTHLGVIDNHHVWNYHLVVGYNNFKKRSTCTRGYFHEGFYVLEAQWCHKPGHWAKTGGHDRDIPNEEMLLPWLTLHWCKKCCKWWIGFCEPYIVLRENHHNIPPWMGFLVILISRRSCRKENPADWAPKVWDNFCSQSDHRFVQIIQDMTETSKSKKSRKDIKHKNQMLHLSFHNIHTTQYYCFCRLSSMAHAEGCNFPAEPKDSTWSCNVGAIRGAQLVAAKSSWNTKVLRKFHINKCWNKNNIPNGSTKNKKWVSLHWQA